MDPQPSSEDPIIRTMQDPPAHIPFERNPNDTPEAPMPNPLTNSRPDHIINPSAPASRPPPLPPRKPNSRGAADGFPASPPRNLGNPPAPGPAAPNNPQTAPRPPETSRPAPEPKHPSPPPPPMPESPFIASPHSAKTETPSIPTAPPPSGKPAFSEQTPHASKPSHALFTLAILTLLLVAGGTVLLWLKSNAIGNDAKQSAATLAQNVGILTSKVDDFDTTVKTIQDANGACHQDLFTAGADTLTCADGVSKIADALIMEGERFRAEGDAEKNQSKSSEGQWLIDRGNELKQNATDCAAKGTAAQTRSGIPVNK